MTYIVPDTPIFKKPLWQIFSIRDAIYGAILVFMLLNQHFNQESRLERLESAQVQMADTMSAIQKATVPRQEIESDRVNVNIRLSNIEAGQNNLMTYLLNHGK